VIGAAALAVGLLLILTGLSAARIPGEASFASSGILAFLDPREKTAVGWRAREQIRAFLLSPIHPATWYANVAIGLGFFVGVFAFAILASVFSAGASTLFVGIGIVFIGLGIEGSRLFARLERRRATLADPRPLTPHPYRPLAGRLRDLLRAEFADESRWRDVLYVGVNFPLVIIEFTVAVLVWTLALTLVTMPLWYDAVAGSSLPWYLGWLGGHGTPVALLRFLVGAALLPVAASLSQLVMALHRAVVTGLLCTSESRELRRQVESLRESRSAVLDVEASELRRIERDLHDGAQQRLVMLTIDLGLASERIDTDPEAAKQLVLEGREQARQALAELRNLVRGIAPAILIDRGLVPALASVAAHGPVPTTVEADLQPGWRLPDAIERAAYFVASEALANAAKHSGATRCTLRCHRVGSSLLIEVEDDGAGGAVIAPGGGLAGLAGRVEAVDGTFAVSSPAGGPTVVRAELPVAAWAAAGPSATTP
jgi:signal transduction histidine kinase